MPKFCVNSNAQSDGYHEVHNLDKPCPEPPAPHNQIDLGYHMSCHGAVTKAKTLYPKSDGCAHCCPECHTR
jgi:hypothetical protein